jgi:uncharacterized protein (UPF0276 family)
VGEEAAPAPARPALSADLSDALLALEDAGRLPMLDAVETGPWFSLEQTRAYRARLPRLPFHFHGAGLVEGAGFWPGQAARIEAYRAAAGSPWVSLHISVWPPGWVRLAKTGRVRLPPLPPRLAVALFIRRVNALRAALGAARRGVPLWLENNEPLPLPGCAFEVEPGWITHILAQTGCGLLLDGAHARVAAERLGLDLDDYLAGLPLERVCQLHISGTRRRAGRLYDAHETLTAADLDLARRLLERTRPRVVTLEYIRGAEALAAQLAQLAELIERTS